MHTSSEGLHDHIKKSKHKKPGPFIDRAIYGIGLVGPIMTIPQITKIWIEKNTSGISALSWTSYMIVAIFWIIYGLAHKEKPLVFISGIWIVLDGFILAGTVLYR